MKNQQLVAGFSYTTVPRVGIGKIASNPCKRFQATGVALS